MSRNSEPVKTRKKDEDILDSLPGELASQVEEMSRISGASVKNLLATFIWMGKKAFGREVVITGEEETKQLRISVLKRYSKISPIDSK